MLLPSQSQSKSPLQGSLKRTKFLYLLLDASNDYYRIHKRKGGYQRVDLENGKLSRQESARGSLTSRYNSIVPNNATTICLLEGESKLDAQIKEKIFFEHIHAIHHPTNLDESNLQEAIHLIHHWPEDFVCFLYLIVPRLEHNKKIYACTA